VNGSARSAIDLSILVRSSTNSFMQRILTTIRASFSARSLTRTMVAYSLFAFGPISTGRFCIETPSAVAFRSIVLMVVLNLAAISDAVESLAAIEISSRSSFQLNQPGRFQTIYFFDPIDAQYVFKLVYSHTPEGLQKLNAVVIEDWFKRLASGAANAREIASLLDKAITNITSIRHLAEAPPT
jgi:hypothetical protein